MTLLYAILAIFSFGVSWGGTIVCAFASFISFAMINSSWADKKKANTALTVLGVILALATFFFVYSLTKVTNN